MDMAASTPPTSHREDSSTPLEMRLEGMSWVMFVSRVHGASEEMSPEGDTAVNMRLADTAKAKEKPWQPGVSQQAMRQAPSVEAARGVADRREPKRSVRGRER